MFRLAALLLAALPLTASASAGPRHHRAPAPAPVCEAGELRVSAARNAWFDVYVNGRQVIESRIRDGQQSVGLAPGRHHVRITSFVGQVWNEQILDVRCGEVFIGEVHESAGMQVLTTLGPTQPTYASYGRPVARPPAGRPGRPYARPVAYTQPVCTAGSLGVSAFQNAWFDLYVDGVKRVTSRNFDGQQIVEGLQPGRHFVRVTSFVGDVWSEGYVDVGCNQAVYGEVVEDRGLRVF